MSKDRHEADDMSKKQELGDMSKVFKIVNGDMSDGYHTFDELYEHRVALYRALAKKGDWTPYWRCDFDGWFCLYLETPKGQISYHLPEKYLEDVKGWALDADKCGYKYDGHTSAQVLERLLSL